MIDFEYCVSGVMVSNPPQWNLLQASANGAETWGEKEEVEARHPSSKGDMQLYAYH